MSRFNIASRIREEEEREEEQQKLRKKHSIEEDNVVIVEKSNVYKFTVKTLIALIKTVASILLITLAVVGLYTLIYPSIRIEFFSVLNDTIQQIKSLI